MEQVREHRQTIAVVHYERAALFRLSVALSRNAFDVTAIESRDPLRAVEGALRVGAAAVIVAVSDAVLDAGTVTNPRVLLLTQSPAVERQLRARGARVLDEGAPIAVVIAELCAMLAGLAVP
jgi:hypothetical protein